MNILKIKSLQEQKWSDGTYRTPKNKKKIMRQMPFSRPHCSKCSNNILITNCLEYLPLVVTYYQVTEPFIIDLAMQFAPSLNKITICSLLALDRKTKVFIKLQKMTNLKYSHANLNKMRCFDYRTRILGSVKSALSTKSDLYNFKVDTSLQLKQNQVLPGPPVQVLVGKTTQPRDQLTQVQN